MNRVYKVIFNRRSGLYTVVSEAARNSGKGQTRGILKPLGAALLATSVNFVPSLIPDAFGQEAPCTAGVGGTMYNADSTCVNYEPLAKLKPRGELTALPSAKEVAGAT